MSKPNQLRTAAAALLALAILPACASSGSGSSGSGQDSEVILLEEIEAESAGQDVLALIQSRRPRWLRGRSSTFAGTTPPAVIIDGIQQPGGLDALRTMRAIDAQEIRFVNSRDATTRYGPGMMSGAILVTRKR